MFFLPFVSVIYLSDVNESISYIYGGNAPGRWTELSVKSSTQLARDGYIKGLFVHALCGGQTPRGR